jgi:hypothetical protein
MSHARIAFAGPGYATPEIIKTLLNDYLGLGLEDAERLPAPTDDDIELIFPLRVEHLGAGVLNVLAWTKSMGLPFTAITDENEASNMVVNLAREAHEVLPVSDVNAKVVEMLASATGEGVLILLWGEGEYAGDEESEILLNLAVTKGIKALDLTAGLDDIAFAED